MRSQVQAIGNNTTCSHSCSCWMENSKHYQKIKPEPHGGTLTTTAITMVESMLDKLKEARVINNKAGRYNHVYEYPLTALLTTFSIVFDRVNWWNSVFAWWCLSLWPCLIRFFVMIVGVLWVFYLQWHRLPRCVLMYLPPPCYLLSFYLIL